MSAKEKNGVKLQGSITYTTGRLARKAGVNLQTIRYYERSGLLPAPQRDESGYRQYDESSFNRLKFIRKSQTLGFSLKEIQELLELRESGNRTCKDVGKLIHERIISVEDKIDELQKIHSVLTEMVKECDEVKSAPECPCIRQIDEKEQLIVLSKAV